MLKTDQGSEDAASTPKDTQVVLKSNFSTRANSGEGLTTVSAELFRSPLSLYSSSKTHLAAGNRESKCQGFNDHTFLAGRNPCGGCSKRARSPRASPPSKTPERLKKKPTGQPVLYQRRGPSHFGLGPLRAPAFRPSCSLATGRSAVSQAPVKVRD